MRGFHGRGHRHGGGRFAFGGGVYARQRGFHGWHWPFAADAERREEAATPAAEFVTAGVQGEPCNRQCRACVEVVCLRSGKARVRRS